jgi:hypothetical protein
VERQDILAVLTRLKNSDLPEHPRADQSEDRVYTIGGIPTRKYGRERDDFGMIVPYGAPGVIPESPSSTVQANKRRKIMKKPRDSSSESEDLPVTLSSRQCSSPPAYTTDSEMTDFVVNWQKNTLNWSDTTCLIVYLMLCTTLLYCCLANECVSRRLYKLTTF